MEVIHKETIDFLIYSLTPRQITEIKVTEVKVTEVQLTEV